MQLLEDRVLVRMKPPEAVSEGGIVLPTTEKKSNYAVVVKSGEGRYLQNGDLVYNKTSQGNTVILANYAGTEVEVNGEKLVIVRESDILAIL